VDKAVRNAKKPDGFPYTAKELLEEASRRAQARLDRMLREHPQAGRSEKPGVTPERSVQP
jgi:hypothetical protein